MSRMMTVRVISVTFCLIIFLAIAVGEGECDTGEKPLVRFGINLRFSPVRLYERYQPLMDYLTQNTPYRFELKISRNYQEAVRDLKEGRTQIASLGDGAYVEAILLHGAMPVVKPLNRYGKPFYRSVIVVPRDSRIASLAGLRGRSVAFGSHHSVSGNLVPRNLLALAGLSQRDLGFSIALKNHNSVAKAVLKGIFEAGAVKEVFAERHERDGLRVLASSDPIPSVPLVARGEAPKEMIRAVADALLKLDYRNPADRKIMAAWDREFQYGFVPAHPSDYRDIFRLFKSIPHGCASGCHQ